MPEHTLDELKELAKPALRHAELIDIARAETPNSADTKASIRWPRRQAKATRFLAMLRRDYGQQAFEAYLLEHARPQGSEHAQGVRMITFDSVYPVGVQHLHFYVPPGGEGRRLETLHIAEFRVGWPHRKNEVLLNDEVARLNLNKNKEEELVRRVIASMFASHENLEYRRSVGGDIWAAALVAVRELLPKDKELYKKVLLAAVFYMGIRAEHPGVFAQSIGASLPKGASWNNAQMSLQCAIDHLLKQGCSEVEVAKVWADMLDTRSKQGYHAVLVYSWWAGLKIGKIQVDDYNNGIAQPAARHCVRGELSWFLENDGSDFGEHYGDAVEEGRMRVLQSMVNDCGLDWCWKEGREMLEEMIATCLARGQAGKAFYFFVRFGKSFQLHDEDRDCRRTDTVRTKFTPLVRGAIDKAKDVNNIGVASALAEYLGETAVADELRERARHLKQPIILEFMFYAYTPHNYSDPHSD